jgi:DNA (cytosine-5)-methyltransferase 1
MFAMPRFYEFFAGGGMARAGLGGLWQCLFANDNDAKKAACYAANWGGRELKVADVGALSPADLPGRADLAWASFPCQDLSLAGNQAGLNGARSGTFWPFWGLMRALAEGGRAPAVVVLENVCGALTSHGGEDFAAIGAALADGGYCFGALVMDAVRFLPQSRPRLFIVGVRDERRIAGWLRRAEPGPAWQPPRLMDAYEKLPARAKAAWMWWNLPEPPPRTKALAECLEDPPHGVEWHSDPETRRLLALMSPLHRRKVEAAMSAGRPVVGTIYRRTRKDAGGRSAQRAEVRFDGISGCLRTPAGGSSRQTILVVDGREVRSRLLSVREAARLMGLPESYRLPENYSEAYHLAGDGVAVPVVRFLAEHLLEPLLDGRERQTAAQCAALTPVG